MKPAQLSAQLYTVRDLCTSPEATAEVLKKIKVIGYAAVEVAGIVPIKPSELKAMVADAGLAIAGYSTPYILEEAERFLDELATLDIPLGVYSYPGGFNLGEEADVDRLTALLIEAGTKFRNAGKTLLYHHHSLEFTPFRGRTVFEHLLDIDPELLKIEMDCFWIQHGGGNPPDWLRRLAGRVDILHLKDFGNILGTPTFMEVGNGNLDWKKIIPAADEAGVKWFSVEQDTCPRGSLESLKVSYDYISANLFS